MQKTSITSILDPALSYKIAGTLWMECEGQRFFGPGRVELLTNIEKTGSIKKAAELMGMSYKKAWEMISALNTQAKVPFVVTQKGGDNGGGSIITEEAKQLIAYHLQLRKRFEAFLQKETKELFST
jgi:molybdate transport system regulatory protein